MKWEIPFESGDAVYTNGWHSIQLAASIANEVYEPHRTLHFYWREPLPFGRKQAAAIKSAIVTQDLARTKIILWSNVDLSGNEFVKPMLPYITLRIFNPLIEAIDSPLEGLFEVLTKDDPKCWLGGDLFRLLTLFNYGGVYVDCDVLLQRDLAPLLENEFVYQWGTEKDKMNGAVMRMFERSPFASACLDALATGSAGYETTDWGSTLYSRVRAQRKDFAVLPCAFFNPEWQLFINMGESAHPFRKGADSEKDFPGTFAWHWHNKWNDPIEKGCKFERLESAINATFQRMTEGRSL